MISNFTDYILAGKSKPYTKTTGCVISEANGVRETLSNVKRLVIHLPEPIKRGDIYYAPPILLPAGLTVDDFIDATLYEPGYARGGDGVIIGKSIAIKKFELIGALENSPTITLSVGEQMSRFNDYVYLIDTGIFMHMPILAALEVSQQDPTEDFAKLYNAMVGIEEDDEEDDGSGE